MRPLIFLVCVLFSVIGNLYLENREVRADQESMKLSYSAFLARKAGGKTLAERIRPDSLAVFKARSGIVACALMGETNGRPRP